MTMTIKDLWPDLAAIDPHFIYSGNRKNKVQMPLGGIGAGGIGLSGNGRLVDWNIRNRARMGHYNGYSHFAVKAERTDGTLADARVLNGPYDGDAVGAFGHRRFTGYGIGATWGALAGLPHFEDATFFGRFPGADIVFSDTRFPGAVRVSASSPFIPHNDRDSSFPGAVFEIEVVNTSSESLRYSACATLANLDQPSGVHTMSEADGTHVLSMLDADRSNSGLALASDAEDVSATAYHFRGQWFDGLSTFWRDFATPGRLPARDYEAPRPVSNMFGQPEHGSLAAHFELSPGERRIVRFVIAWSYPEGDIYWYQRRSPGDADYSGEPPPRWRNYYASQWPDPERVALELLTRWNQLAAQTNSFRDAVFGSGLPTPLIDAAMSTLCILRTPTVIRLEDGTMWAWEGTFENEGSCEGSCTHVWNYAQALTSLFPALERSLRETEWTHNQQPDGGLTFRQRLPLGSGLDQIGPCADGHFGAVIKTYRDWKLSGDNEWLKPFWPAIRRAMEYAWSAENPNAWDPDRTGLLWGKQHHTLDMELFGPNAWLSGFYIAALNAASEMANVLGDKEFSEKCGALARKGRAALENELFNGKHFIQAIDITNREVLEPYANHAAGVLADDFVAGYWDAEHGEIKYQIASGCLTDQLLGQWHSELSGLPDIADPQMIDTALLTIHSRNFVTRLGEVANPCRVYGFEDEAGTQVCTFEGEPPAIPVPYAEEVWTGQEYMLASHLIRRGHRAEGLQIVVAARARYDGRRRNPYSDIECGNYYARSLSSWALVNAWSGFAWDGRTGTIRFAPADATDGHLFWSAGAAWGVYEHRGDHHRITVCSGHIKLDAVALPNLAGSVVTVADTTVFTQDGSIKLPSTVPLSAGAALDIVVSTATVGMLAEPKENLHG